MAKDLFSQQAADYAKYRPSYPPALIEYIVGFVHEKHHAWDCATGNGQAAVLISNYFEKISATDSSEKQLALAIPAQNIHYQVCKAEKTPFLDNSFDLITIAQAYHWFDFDAFEQEVKRVAKPGAVIAAWGYNIPVCDHDAINQLIHHFYAAVAGPYWDPERKFIDEAYQTVPFNFAPLPSKDFTIDVQWNKANLAGYLSSWSSVQHFIKANHYNPVNEMATQLAAAWPSLKDTLLFRFPVFLRLGEVSNKL